MPSMPSRHSIQPPTQRNHTGADNNAHRQRIAEEPDGEDERDELADVENDADCQGGGLGGEAVHAADADVLGDGVEEEGGGDGRREGEEGVDCGGDWWVGGELRWEECGVEARGEVGCCGG